MPINSWLQNVRLRTSDEERADASSGKRSGAGGGKRSGAGRGSVIGTAGGRCMVKVSRNNSASPGAATPRYHEGRENVEIVRDDVNIVALGPRWSITVSPERADTDLHELGSYVLMKIEDAHSTTLSGTFLAVHRDTARPHIHISVSASDGVYLSQTRVERAVQDAMRSMARDRSRTQGASR